MTDLKIDDLNNEKERLVSDRETLLKRLDELQKSTQENFVTLFARAYVSVQVTIRHHPSTVFTWSVDENILLFAVPINKSGDAYHVPLSWRR